MTYLFMRDLAIAKRRILGTIGVLSAIFTLVFVLSGVINQFEIEPELATRSIGADRHWIISEASTGPLTSPVPALPVDSATGTPVVMGSSSIDGVRAMVVGREELADASTLTDGRWAREDDELVVDETTGFAVGDRVDLGGREATVVGRTHDATLLAGTPMAFTTVAAASSVLLNGNDEVLVALLTEAPPDDVPPGTWVLSAEEVAADGFLPLENAVSSVSLINMLLWAIAIVVTASVTYVTALERTRQFAVLKAVGARGRTVAMSMLAQAVAVALLAAGLAALAQTFVAPLFPMAVRVPSAAFLRIPLVAVAVALAAGAAGTRHAARVQPSEAFA